MHLGKELTSSEPLPQQQPRKRQRRPWVSNAQHCESNSATCRWQVATLPMVLGKTEKFLLLQCFLHSHSHGNGSADHGVVAHAQEAHHLYVKSALRRLCGDFSRAFEAVSPTFRKTRDTSIVSIGCAFLTETHLITSFVHETRSFD